MRAGSSDDRVRHDLARAGADADQQGVVAAARVRPRCGRRGCRDRPRRAVSDRRACPCSSVKRARSRRARAAPGTARARPRAVDELRRGSHQGDGDPLAGELAEGEDPSSEATPPPAMTTSNTAVKLAAAPPGCRPGSSVEGPPQTTVCGWPGTSPVVHLPERVRPDRDRRQARGASAPLVFFASALAVIPAAALMSDATEQLSARTGPGIAGLAQRDVRQRARADHRVLRAARRTPGGRQGVARRLGDRQLAARARRGDGDRRAQPDRQTFDRTAAQNSLGAAAGDRQRA